MQKTRKESQLHLAEVAQPVCTALQIGLVNSLRRRGIFPSAVLGHSSGEIAAAYAAGVLSLQAAITISYYRGFITKGKTMKGGMAAVGLGADEIANFLSDGVIMACENSSSSVTISGDLDVVDGIIKRLKKELPDVFVRKLKVNMAYHSRKLCTLISFQSLINTLDHMKLLGTDYQQLIEAEFCDNFICPNNPEIPFFSSVTEDLLDEAAMFKPDYWVSNLVSPVRFKSAITRALKARLKDIYVEIGPHSTLAGSINSANSDTSVTCPYVSTLQRDADCEASLLSAFGKLYQYSAAIDLEKLMPHGQVLSDIPAYPWDHSGSYWQI